MIEKSSILEKARFLKNAFVASAALLVVFPAAGTGL